MLKIIDIDNTNRLYSVENLLTMDELSDIQSIDWCNLSTMPHPQWMLLERSRVAETQPEVLRCNTYIYNAFDRINAILGTNFSRPTASAWWIDRPGLRIDIHTDNVTVTNALQMYWIIPGEDYGTCFYRDLTLNNSDQSNRKVNEVEITHQFMSKPNHGYFMLNENNNAGEKPSQWHGMLNAVPPDTFRLSSYSVVKSCL